MKHWLTSSLPLIVTVGSCSVVAGEPTAATDVFPATGHIYRVDFGGGNAFDIAFRSDREMTFTKRQEPRKGMVETIHFTHKKLRDGLYMVYWQEADKTTVVHVEDFAKGLIYSNITSPDGTFFNGSSTLTKIK